MIPDIEAADVPVNPFRSGLYSTAELLGEFDDDDPLSYMATIDFATYRTYVHNGRMARVPYMQSIVRAIHDNSISQARNRFIDGRRIVGVMGGHRLQRDSSSYRQVVELAKTLAERGFTMASGGGPGAMEATHVGAHLANGSSTELEEAIAMMAGVPELPGDLTDLVAEDGSPDEDIVARLHAWQAPAFELARTRDPGAESLAIPTWHYGHEPPTPLASHIAKYFQNAIREDGLLAIATYGIVFTEGRAGTLQEVFQDAAQNYYRSFGWFSPMVLLGVDFWTRQFPVVDVLAALFGEVDLSCVTVTDDLAEAVEAIESFTPPSFA